jgi:hypothetical protein
MPASGPKQPTQLLGLCDFLPSISVNVVIILKPRQSKAMVELKAQGECARYAGTGRDRARYRFC